MRTALISLGLLIAIALYYRQTSNQKIQAFQHQIQTLEQENKRLRDRIAELEKPKTQSPPPLPTPIPAPRVEPAPAPTAQTTPSRIIDVPGPGSPVCTFATIQSTTKLAHNLTWDIQNGGTYIGDLPAGSIVEILYANLYIWNDYPDEHALYIKVAESTNKEIENQIGYIELRRIGFKACNLGVDFEK